MLSDLRIRRIISTEKIEVDSETLCFHPLGWRPRHFRTVHRTEFCDLRRFANNTADFRIRFPRGVRVQNPRPEFIFRVRPFRGNNIIIEIIRIQRRHRPARLQIVETSDASRFRSRLIQSRQKQPGKDGDDGNYHKELYKGEFIEISLEI